MVGAAAVRPSRNPTTKNTRFRTTDPPWLDHHPHDLSVHGLDHEGHEGHEGGIQRALWPASDLRGFVLFLLRDLRGLESRSPDEVPGSEFELHREPHKTRADETL